MTNRLPRLRCAIYTRKSSEEGLEQDFNSLDAQREASEAYIRSQAELGWQVLKQRYDDGGYSGGTLERPGLQRLLADVRDKRLDVIVLYKIDRLTRSLTDFARLAELLDAHGVSFVSVTQQFNTTTSMGRLMLNVLLSFAQFEREITGERIRDKIAASKKKGMWMGGIPPLGYDAVDRGLVVNVEEAETIRTIFRLYLELGAVRPLQARTRELGIRTRQRTAGVGRLSGGRLLSRGHLYRILQNPVYIGQIRHRNMTYEGQHPAIVDADTWQRVQEQLSTNQQGHHRRTRAREPSLLAGLLRDAEGHRLIPSHATKGERRYRYYVQEQLVAGASSLAGLRLPAHEVDSAVQRAVLDALKAPHAMLTLFKGRLSAQQTAIAVQRSTDRYAELSRATPQQWRDALRPLVSCVQVQADALQITLRCQALAGYLGVHDVGWQPAETVSLTVPVRLTHRRNQMRVIVNPGSGGTAGAPDSTLTAVLARATSWRQRLEDGDVNSLDEIAATEKLTSSYVGRVLRLAYLAPDIIEAIVDGRHPAELSAQQLLYRHDLPLDWREQRGSLGLAEI